MTLPESIVTSKYGKINHGWFIQYEGSEFGPYSEQEVAHVVKGGKLKGELYAWRKGLANWIPVTEVIELGELLSLV